MTYEGLNHSVRRCSWHRDM